MEKINYFIVLRRNGNCVCGFEQIKGGDDTVGLHTIDNLQVNCLECINIQKALYDLFKIPKVKAKDLNDFLLEQGFAPY